MNEGQTLAPVLTVADLRVAFRTLRGEVRAVNGVSFTLHRGRTLAIVGESGSGKSVTAKSVIGLTRARNASVEAAGITLSDIDFLNATEAQRRDMRGSSISLVFQDAQAALNPVQTVGSQLAEPFRIHEGLSRRAARARAIDLLERVRIPSAQARVDDYPHQFSGGMRQRLLIAVAIALNPAVLIADEPTTALDVTVQAQILDLLDELRIDLGMAILLITHDLGVVARLADDVAVMYAGRFVEMAPVGALFAAPRHPYTAALLASAPRIEASSRLDPVTGTPPDLVSLPSGCPFHPRCPRFEARCRTERPPLAEHRGGGRVACHFPLIDPQASRHA